MLRHAAFIAVLMSGMGLMTRSDAASATESALLAQGAYLTGPAGQCSDCHGQGLHGGKGLAAPNLAGLKMFANDADAIRFFETALLPSGKHAAAPMGRYMFNPADARAIVAYLKQLR